MILSISLHLVLPIEGSVRNLLNRFGLILDFRENIAVNIKGYVSCMVLLAWNKRKRSAVWN